MRAGLIKTSLVNYPGKAAAAVFLPGCNLRCPYCYNAGLALADPAAGADEGFAEEEIFRHMEKRRRVLGGIAISGGEPLLSPLLEPLILKAKSLGLSVKVDTNGTLPEKLRLLIEDERIRPDMIALDVKTAPKKYRMLAPQGGEGLGAAVVKSIGILARAAAEKLLSAEYRTVLAPGIADEADVLEIAALLPEGAIWRLAPFMPANCLDPAWSKKKPCTRPEMEKIAGAAREIVPGAELRA